MKSLLSLAAATLLVASVTACGSSSEPSADEPTETGSVTATPSEPTETASVAPTESGVPKGATAPTATATVPTSTSEDGATKDGAAKGGSGEGKRADAPCRSKDLRFNVAVKTQAGGFYLITASAKPGVSCVLEGVTAPVAFGSSEDSHAGPVGHAVGDPVVVSGDKKAYAGVNPKSVQADGLTYEQIIVSATAADPNPVSFKLPDGAEVNSPVATNWVAKAGDAVPF